MNFKTFSMGFVLILAMLTAGFAQVCVNSVCNGGPSDGYQCARNVDCERDPVVPYTFNNENASLAADITLGVMGVAVAAIITLVGFTIYAKNAKKVRPSRSSKKRRR